MDKESLGLTEIEFEIFRRILGKGETSLGPIIKELGLHKGTAYNAIRRLEEKGLVSFKEVNKINVYSVNLFSLKKLSAEEEMASRQRIEGIKEIIKKVESVKKPEEEAKVNILVGPEGFKTFFNDLYEWAHKTKKEYLFLGKGNEMIENLGEEYYKTTQIIKKKLGLKCRVILNEVSKKLPVKEHVVGDVRYLKMNYLSPVSTWIYGNKVVIVLWDSKPLMTIIIDSKGASDSYKSFFEAMWEIAKVEESKHGKEIENITFNTINEFYNFILSEFDHPPISNKKRFSICIFEHMWCPLISSSLQFGHFKNILRNIGAYVLCRNKTNLDKWFGKIYGNNGAKMYYGFQDFKNEDLLISGSRIVTVYFSADIKKELDRIYKTAKNLNQLDLNNLYKQIMDKKTKIYVTINRNPILAKEMAKDIFIKLKRPLKELDNYY